MSKILFFQTVHSTPRIHPRIVTSILSKPLIIPSVSKCYSPIFPFHSISLPALKHHFHSPSFSFPSSFPTRAFDDSSSSIETQNEKEEKVGEQSEIEEYPSGEMEYEKISGWKSFVVKLKMLIAFPWQRVRKGSVLTMKLRGQVGGLNLFAGVLEKIGIEPQVERIGKYKSAGDQLTRKSMSEENCEMLTSLLDNIYGNWLDVVSSSKGKKREDVEHFINEGVYEVEKLKEEGFITNIHYDDEVISMLKERLGVQKDKKLSMVDYKKYSKVRKWTLGLTGGKDLIAVIRATGSISRVRSPLSTPSSGIVAEQIIEKIRSVRGTPHFNLLAMMCRLGKKSNSKGFI
ncbi:hypothetical protein GOBAR_AA39204 [Gossypium barbadense]|uniref:Peptidase S49 domain-containing protein n=1 Tax=Gossypium barbadense TaxID=3634 RepID=A0A2P5VRN2_GOSBA|nr:hypothetical protein GOBAR_AA39204 [Gossypium barbadense]